MPLWLTLENTGKLRDMLLSKDLPQVEEEGTLPNLLQKKVGRSWQVHLWTLYIAYTVELIRIRERKKCGNNRYD